MYPSYLPEKHVDFLFRTIFVSVSGYIRLIEYINNQRDCPWPCGHLQHDAFRIVTVGVMKHGIDERIDDCKIRMHSSIALPSWRLIFLRFDMIYTLQDPIPIIPNHHSQAAV